MKLSYRGINYDFNPSSLQARGAKHRLNNVAKDRALGAILTYRGQAYSIKPSNQTASSHSSAVPNKVLTYRGVSYTVKPTETVQPVAAAPVTTASAAIKAPTPSVQDQARALTMNHHRAMKKRQQVMLVRSAAEAGITAGSHWERLQETFNPTFQATYDRSYAALS